MKRLLNYGLIIIFQNTIYFMIMMNKIKIKERYKDMNLKKYWICLKDYKWMLEEVIIFYIIF